MEDKKTIWNDAGFAGIVLGGMSIVFLMLNWLTSLLSESGTATVILGILNFVLWAAKLAACLYFLHFFLKKFSNNNPDADHEDVFKQGMRIALLSALIYSAFYLAYSLFIAPDQFEEALDLLQDNPMMDSNTMEMMENLIPKMPTISFFGNLIYCWLFGTIASAIMSRNIPSDNPFNQ